MSGIRTRATGSGFIRFHPWGSSSPLGSLLGSGSPIGGWVLGSRVHALYTGHEPVNPEPTGVKIRFEPILSPVTLSPGARTSESAAGVAASKTAEARGHRRRKCDGTRDDSEPRVLAVCCGLGGPRSLGAVTAAGSQVHFRFTIGSGSKSVLTLVCPHAPGSVRVLVARG